MPRISLFRRFLATPGASGPAFIVVGLTLLLASLQIPALPPVTAMAIMTLGATQSTFSRFRQSPTLPTIMLLHGAVYFSLYTMFVCAVLYTPAAASLRSLSPRAMLDLVASILPMSVALQTVGSSLRPAGDSRQ